MTSGLAEENRRRDARPEILEGGFEALDALLFFRPCDTQN